MGSVGRLAALTVVLLGVSGSPIAGEGSGIGDLWEVGEARNYIFRMGDARIGEQSNRLVRVEDGTYTFEQGLRLDLSRFGSNAKLEQSATLSVDPHGVPLSYTLVGNGFSLGVSFGDGYADVSVYSSGRVDRRRVACSGEAFLVDQNFIGDLGLALCVSNLREGVKMPFRMFVPQLLREVSAELRVDRSEGPGDVAYVGEITPLGWSVWISKEGELLRMYDAAQNLTVELERPSEAQRR